PQIAVDLAREPDLDDEADARRPELYGREERRDRVGRAGTLRCRGGHVQLLIDDRGADRCEADDERDDLQVLRLAQQVQRLGGAPAFLVLLFWRRARLRGGRIDA